MSPRPIQLRGYVGVINGKAAFAKVSDERGEAHEIQIFKTAAEALERWAYVRRVSIILHEEVTQPRDRGPL